MEPTEQSETKAKNPDPPPVANLACPICQRPVTPKKGMPHWFECRPCGLQMIPCAICGKIIVPGHSITSYVQLWTSYGTRTSRDQKLICTTCCRAKKYVKCTLCNFYGPEEELVSLPGISGRMCPYCGSKYAVCLVCRRVVTKAEMQEGHPEICHNCWENQNTNGVYIGIGSAAFRPVPHFFGAEPPFYGIELEVDVKQMDYNAGNSHLFDRDGCVAALNQLIKKYKTFYLKNDGSLRHGFELVSYPHNMDAWKEQTWLEEACKTVKTYNGASYNTGTCGLHVHRSRQDLTDLHLSLLIVLFVRLQPFFERVAQRKENGYCHYAFFQDGPTSGLNGNVIYKAVKEKRGSIISRYQAFNITNPATVECRIFRGTLCHGSVLAYVKFFHWLCEFAKQKDTVLGKVLRYPVVELWNMVADFFTIDPVLTAFLQEKKVLLKGTRASQKVLDSGLFVGEPAQASRANCDPSDDV